MNYRTTGLSLASAILTVSALTGCLTTGSTNTNATVAKAAPYLRPAAVLTASGALIAAKPAQQASTAAWFSSTADALLQLASTETPTIEKVRLVIQRATPNGQQYEVLATSLVALYAGVFPNVKLDAEAASRALTEIAQGLKDAAAPFLPKPTVAPAI